MFKQNIKNRKMDMERPLKFQGQFFGVETDSDFNECFHESFLQEVPHPCQQYSNQNTGFESQANLIERIKCSANVALTPMSELMLIAKNDFDFTLFDYSQLQRSLRKTKLIEKRERAKNRKKTPFLVEKQSNKVIEVISVDRSEDIKKQKNRLSAQISRDRKKQYYTKLEVQNQELKKAVCQLKRTNIELEKKALKQSEETKKRPEKADNLFKTLLIFLGIIFLINLIKNSGLKSEKTGQKFIMSKFQLTKNEKNFVNEEMKQFGIEIPIQLMEKPKNQIIVDRSLYTKILQAKPTL